MKRVEVRPYGVSKGAAMTTILERIVGPVNRRIAEETAEGDSAGSSPSANKPAELAEGAPAEGGAERPTPPLPQALAGVSASMPPNSAEKSSRENLSSIDGARSADGAADGSEVSKMAGGFGWVVCVSEVLNRDEDLFVALSEHVAGESRPDNSHNAEEAALLEADASERHIGGGSPEVRMTPSASANTFVSSTYTGGSNTTLSAAIFSAEEERLIYTCCVGKTLSQADYHLPDCTATVGLLDILAHASFDPAAAGASSEIPQLPSVLERPHQVRISASPRPQLQALARRRSRPRSRP